MPIIDRRNKPLPEGHPFKGTTILFGLRRPVPTTEVASGAAEPTRERFATEQEYEDAVAAWRKSVTQTKAVRDHSAGDGTEGD